MVTKDYVNAQLKRLGIPRNGWGSSELNELQSILMPNEEITGHSHGWYENGFATLIATSERLLLIDKKVFHLTIEDVRYDMIAEVDFNASVIDATIRVTSMNKTLKFTSFKQQRLRSLTQYIQQRVMEMRQQMFTWQQFEQTPHSTEAPKFNLAPQAAAGPAMDWQAPTEQAPLRRVAGMNPYTKSALTTKHKFLPKVPRRWSPS